MVVVIIIVDIYNFEIYIWLVLKWEVNKYYDFNVIMFLLFFIYLCIFIVFIVFKWKIKFRIKLVYVFYKSLMGKELKRYVIKCFIKIVKNE